MNLAPWTAKLRAWQERAFAAVMTHAGTDFLAMACPGAGKTTVGLRVAHQWLADRAVDRIVVVAPTNHLRGQWAQAAARVGLHLDPDLSNEQGVEARDYHGAVVTYHQVALAPRVYAQACRTRRTVVLFDELHHAGEAKAWGGALRQAFQGAVRRLALSGTPFRSDNQPIPFIRYDAEMSRPDFAYGYTEALRDRVCRPIVFPAYEGDLAWKSSHAEFQATFADQLTEERARERLKAALLHAGWLGSVIRDAHAELQAMRRNGHREAGGLIVAMNQDHAREVAALVRSLTGKSPAVAVSDDPTATQVIRTYGTSAAPWLVAVNMVSEGVDIPRLRVGVYATNVLTEMYFRQVVGRFVRMQSGLPPGQRASLYLPHDPILVEYARRIKAERDHALTAQAAEDRPRSLFDELEFEGSLFEPLTGVARQETVIGHEEPMAEEASPAPEAPPEPSAPPLHEQKEALRATHRALVGTIARAGGLKHDLINRELIRRTGTRIEQATVAQLRQRLRLLERWRDRGWDGAP